MNTKKRIAEIGAQCVACGCCMKACPRTAIHIKNGITASVDEKKCVGCGKCAGVCPAGVITMMERRAAV